MEDLIYITLYFTEKPCFGFCAYWAGLLRERSYEWPVFENGYGLESVLAHTKFRSQSEFYDEAPHALSIYSWPGP